MAVQANGGAVRRDPESLSTAAARRGNTGQGQIMEGIQGGIIPFAIAGVLVLIILVAFPKITLYLPNLMATVK